MVVSFYRLRCSVGWLEKMLSLLRLVLKGLVMTWQGLYWLTLVLVQVQI
jgi:hypothetical protein